MIDAPGPKSVPSAAREPTAALDLEPPHACRPTRPLSHPPYALPRAQMTTPSGKVIPPRHRKIALLGSRSVGKSSLTVQFVDSHFVDSYYPTIENTFQKVVKYKGHDFNLDIIDTAGQVRLSSPLALAAGAC